MSNDPIAVGYPAIFGGLGSALSMILTALGTSVGISYCGTSLAAAASRRPENIVKSLIPVIMASIISIYGLITGIIISRGIKVDTLNHYTPYKGYKALGSGLATGFAGLASGWAIGVVGYTATISNSAQPRLLFITLLILIFSEALAVYGLIIGLLMSI